MCPCAFRTNSLGGRCCPTFWPRRQRQHLRRHPIMPLAPSSPLPSYNAFCESVETLPVVVKKIQSVPLVSKQIGIRRLSSHANPPVRGELKESGNANTHTYTHTQPNKQTNMYVYENTQIRRSLEIVWSHSFKQRDRRE